MKLLYKLNFEKVALKRGFPIPEAQLKRFTSRIGKKIHALREYEEAARELGFKPQKFTCFICDEKTMRSFQRKFRKLNRSTDILSFPAFESPIGQPKGYLGDIIISLPNVLRNSRRFKVSQENELRRVWIHGILHLIGFDHVRVSKSKVRRMKQIENDLMKLI